MNEEEFKLEQGVALPPRNTRQKITPFEKMEVGESFLVSFAREHAIRTAMYRYSAANPGKRFASRKIPKEGVRIWRTQ